MAVKSISVFGLGKLGSCMVGCFASAGYRVIGVDINPEVVARVASRYPPVPEPGLQELFDKFGKYITATTDYVEAVKNTDASFIIVPTPSLPDGEFFTSIAQTVARQIASVLKRKNSYHLVVLTSTVLPGATERDIKPVLENISRKKCGRDFGLCYSPEFIALGEVIKGLLRPDFFLIGEYDRYSGDELESIYKKLQKSRVSLMDITKQRQPVPIVRMNIINAELTKIAINSFVTGKISFVNTLSQLCSKMKGADAHVVASAVGLDSRIGNKCMVPGPAFGGPCFPRDNRAFSWFARSIGEDAPLALATDLINKRQIDFLVNYVLRAVRAPNAVGLLGLTYKPDTNVIDESQAVEMAKSFLGRGIGVIAYDPVVNIQGVAGGRLPDGVVLVDSLKDCVKLVDVVVLATPHAEFARIKPEHIKDGNRRIPLIDIWGMLRNNGFTQRSLYFVPGVYNPHLT